MSTEAILAAMRNSWGLPPADAPEHEESVPAAAPVPVVNTMPPAIPDTVSAADTCGRFSCEWIGRNVAGRATEDPEAGAARLVELMRAYPIKPHLNHGGGSGFTYPHADGWSAKHWDAVKEFSELWYTAAGDLIIARYGKHMKTMPPFEPKGPEPQED